MLLPIIGAVVLGVLAAAGAHERKSKASVGPDGKPLPKPKSADELAAEAKLAGRKEALAEIAAHRKTEARMRKAIRREVQVESALTAARRSRLEDDDLDDDDDIPAGKAAGGGK